MTETVELKPWPLVGYAPGNYSCVCGSCQKEFVGDKRAWQCLECAAISAKSALTRSDPAVRDRVKPLEWRKLGWTEALADPDGLGVWYAINALDPRERTTLTAALRTSPPEPALDTDQAPIHIQHSVDYGLVTDEMVDAAEAVLKEWKMVNGVRTAARLALTAALRTSPPEPASGLPTHLHKKRGTEYELIGIGKMQAKDWHEMILGVGHVSLDDLPSVDMRDVAIYRGATDPTEIWVRPREEFEDGRFELLPTPPAKEPQ